MSRDEQWASLLCACSCISLFPFPSMCPLYGVSVVPRVGQPWSGKRASSGTLGEKRFCCLWWRSKCCSQVEKLHKKDGKKKLENVVLLEWLLNANNSTKSHWILLVLVAVHGHQKCIRTSQFVVLNCKVPFLVTQCSLPYAQRIFRDHTYIIAQQVHSSSEGIVTVMS